MFTQYRKPWELFAEPVRRRRIRLQRVDGGPGSNGNGVFLVDDLIYALVVELVDFDVAGTVARSVL